MDRSHINRKCPECGWRIHSALSYGYFYCPLCRAELVEYDMRESVKA